MHTLGDLERVVITFEILSTVLFIFYLFRELAILFDVKFFNLYNHTKIWKVQLLFFFNLTFSFLFLDNRFFTKI